MKFGKWLEQWDMISLMVKTPFLEMEFKPQDEDKSAAWELYIELLTRVTSQTLSTSHGDEKTALSSIHSLFETTRMILKNNGRHCVEFTKVAILILNQKIRPFTSKWHKLSIQGAFSDKSKCEEFREELEALQAILLVYMQMLADIAGVEDLTELEDYN